MLIRIRMPTQETKRLKDHLVCFLAGTLALATVHGLPKEHLQLAESLGRSCQAMYANPAGLGLEIAYFNMLPGQNEDLSIKPLDAHSLSAPEAIKSWYLYRMTGDKTYQEWGWNAFEAIEKYARVRNGYSPVKSVRNPCYIQRSDEIVLVAEVSTISIFYLLILKRISIGQMGIQHGSLLYQFMIISICP
ncbi:unnamed protein product [Cylicocyclus nassatus]|uniref:alpha-1,2-Mannosidase n=1 Tax=Cylicocyclus nassatus TaxID=53992 RepID=A0AA36GWI8_CYLNA|nr:unnamed protein product [Cylicocyclus nassatus]